MKTLIFIFFIFTASCIANDVTCYQDASGKILYRTLTNAEQVKMDTVRASISSGITTALESSATFTSKYNRFWELYHAQDEQPLTQDQLVEFGGLGVWLAGNMTK